MGTIKVFNILSFLLFFSWNGNANVKFYAWYIAITNHFSSFFWGKGITTLLIHLLLFHVTIEKVNGKCNFDFDFCKNIKEEENSNLTLSMHPAWWIYWRRTLFDWKFLTPIKLSSFYYGVYETLTFSLWKNFCGTNLISPQLATDAKCRSCPSQVFLGKGVLKICSKFTGEHPYRSMVSMTLLCNFIEIALRHGYSPVNMLHILKTAFYKNTYGGLLLKMEIKPI